MVDLILYGNSNKSLYLTLKQLLSADSSVLCLSPEEYSGVSQPDFLLCRGIAPSQLVCGRFILILGEDPSEGWRLSCGVPAVAVVNSSCRRAVSLAVDAELTTLSCGLRSSDTLTLSSYTEDSAVISLQRSILSLSQRIVEPVDLPVTFRRPLDPFTLLAAAAVCLLCDKVHLLQNTFLN